MNNHLPDVGKMVSPRVPQAGDSLDGIVRGISFEEMDWPAGDFRVLDDGNPHGKLYIVAPGGQIIDVGCHADPRIDAARAQWMCDALNGARAVFARIAAGQRLAVFAAMADEQRDAYVEHQRRISANSEITGPKWSGASEVCK